MVFKQILAERRKLCKPGKGLYKIAKAGYDFKDLAILPIKNYNIAMNEIIAEKLKLLPDAPGVYKMLDCYGEVIYVGKAKNLKNRVRQYFRSTDTLMPKVAAMVSCVCDFEYILVSNEIESLALECNLIKEKRPKYNILLKDDKFFPYIKVDTTRPYPRFEVVRRLPEGRNKQQGIFYFGPYINSSVMREAMTLIRDYYPIRLCKKDIKRAIDRGERPCLMYHIGKCCGPCTGNVSDEEYAGYVNDVIQFLKGDIMPVKNELTYRMNRAAELMDFELAAVYRDRVRAVDAIGEKQHAITTLDRAYDVYALCRKSVDSMVFGLFVREGKVIGTQHYILTAEESESDEDIMASFLQQLYGGSTARSIPSEVLVSVMPTDEEVLSLYLSEINSRRVKIVMPKRGDKLTYVELARSNGFDMLNKRGELVKREWEKGEGALIELSALIGMDTPPHRIECFDNSHITGRDTVGGMVVFTDGKPDRKQYRRFKIRAKAEGDDLLAMREMLTRRFKRTLDGDLKFPLMPELLIVDGGALQLNVALSVLCELGISNVFAIGLSEQNEEIILPGKDAPLILPMKSPALHLIMRIRDEAHRFAISYHRSLRQKNALYSMLSDIPGVGEKRRKALFERFISLDAIKAASVKELSATPGITKPVALAIYEYFHNKD